MIRLKKIIKEIPDLQIKGSKEITITGICSHSKLVAPGNLFVAKRGIKHDGTQFIADAIAAGASCILTDIYNPFLQITQIIHPEINKIEALLAAEYFQNPSHNLHVIGITGTCGKTMTSYLIKHILEAHKKKTGLLGSLGCRIGNHHFPTSLTTEDVITNHKLLKEMLKEGCQHVVMEVSSHALSQNRVEAIDFKAGIFTNLTEEHLDYHQTMKEYAAAKAKLFSSLSKEKYAILNADEPISKDFALLTTAKIVSYGIIDQSADIRACNIILSDKGTKFTLNTPQEEMLISSSLIGRFNIYNLLAALTMCYILGLPLDKSAKSLPSFKQVPGRLMSIPNKLGILLFVDHAHKEDALWNVLVTLKEIKHKKIITVFGCGGDRDRQKRPKMGKVASTFSDQIIVTNDNPRSEDPQCIAQEILQGVSKENFPVKVILDRRLAIAHAIEQASVGDIVLIAGKGHETTQIFAHGVFPFNDAEIARKICMEKENNFEKT